MRIPWPAEAPRDCTGCHSSAVSFSNIELLQSPSEAPLPNEYEPDRTYRLLIRLLDVEPTRLRWGFELAAVMPDLSQGGSFSRVAGTELEVQLVFDGADSVWFPMHRRNGTLQSEWTIDWTAPGPGYGDLTFYFCGIAANGDGGAFGDRIYCGEVMMRVKACSPRPDVIQSLRAARQLDDIVWSWQADARADAGYRLYAVADPVELPDANAATPAALRDCDAPTTADITCTELMAMLDPAPALYYQVVGVCSTGHEGPN